jgi:adenosylhomocysteine nucleosidase
MVGIVFATQREAKPLLDRSSAVGLTQRPFPLYRTKPGRSMSCLVIISNMGKVAAALAASLLVMRWQVKMLISAGLCGRLTPVHDWQVGELFRITHAVEGDCDRMGKPEVPVACDGKWFRQLPKARLVTCDRPVFDVCLRAELAALEDLADMEGAAVARAASCLGIPCAMIKGISDTADANGPQAVADNIDRVSSRIASALVNEIGDMRLG